MKRLGSSFCWHTYDLDGQLRNIVSGWAEQIVAVAKEQVTIARIIPRNCTSREDNQNKVIDTGVVNGELVRSELSWLYDLYRTEFLRLASEAMGMRLTCATEALYGINLNVQRGNRMRYECHVDSNPVQGMLYVTSHTESDGGVLHVANSVGATCVREVSKNCSIIEPKKGQLIFFDAREHSHFVNSLKGGKDAIRVAVAMNFYSDGCPESDRPDDLSSHLGLE